MLCLRRRFCRVRDESSLHEQLTFFRDFLVTELEFHGDFGGILRRFKLVQRQYLPQKNARGVPENKSYEPGRYKAWFQQQQQQLS